MKTLTDLKTEAFGTLVGLDPSQQPAVEDLATIGTYVGPLFEQLEADEIVSIPDQDEIPEAIFLPLSRLLANAAGPRYGQPFNDDAKKRDEAQIKRIVSGTVTAAPLKVEFF
jgi:hypothetical protein